jgi:hypothetical protein
VWSHSPQYSPRLAAQASRSCSQAGNSLQYTHTLEPRPLHTGSMLHFLVPRLAHGLVSRRGHALLAFRRNREMAASRFFMTGAERSAPAQPSEGKRQQYGQTDQTRQPQIQPHPGLGWRGLTPPNQAHAWEISVHHRPRRGV